MGWLDKLARNIETAAREMVEDLDKIIGRALGEED